MRRTLLYVLVSSAILSLAGATGCGAGEPSGQRDAGKAEPVATPKTYFDRIKAAKPGDVIILGEGDYGTAYLNAMKFAEPGVRVEAKPGANVVFESLTLQGSEGIEVRGVEIAIQKSLFGVKVQDSARIRLSGLKIHALNKSELNAAMVRDSHDVGITDSDVRDVGTGISFVDSEHVKIAGNQFDNVQSDAIHGAGSYIEVVGNRASNFHPAEGDHPDFIQFWAAKSGVTTGNVIKNNTFERGSGAVVQGIFIEDNQNITITGNAMAGSMYNGISLSVVKGALVEDNFVQGFNDMDSRIVTRGASTDVIIRNNVAQAIVNYEGEGPNPRYKEEHNKSIGSAKPGDTAAMKTWIARHPER